MKKMLMVSLALCLLTSVGLALGGPAPKTTDNTKPTAEAPLALAEKVFLIDDFESGSLKSPRDWWTFDLARAVAVDNRELTGGDEKVAVEVEKYSMLLNGPAKSWYAGGCGTYLAKEGQDLARYNNISLDIFGRGPNCGTLKIELVDDDNNNWQVEQDVAKNYALTKDDKFTYEVKVDWQGWRRVSVPLADFTDGNPLIGDDTWNPHQQNGSGGLLQVQFVTLANSEKGTVNFNVDNVALTVGQ